MGVELIEAPDRAALGALVAEAGVLLPSPGVPDHHPVFELALELGVAVESEFDLAARFDGRPVVAVTGTDGKTTVTTMVTQMLNRSGIPAVAAGNTELPLVAAIEQSDAAVFVVEASSFRLGHSRSFAPAVATWLNFGADHQDAHGSIEAYESAKAKIWAHLPESAVEVANADDPVVMAHLDRSRNVVTFGTGGDYRVDGGVLRARDEELVAVDELPRALPHDLSNALASAATAASAGAGTDAIREVLRTFPGLPHRVELVVESGGVRWYDDSKATAPHATLSAVRAFESVVLVAGGRNKGLDLEVLGDLRDRLRAVVAIGEAAGELGEVFEGVVPFSVAESMREAVEQAGLAARPGDAVILSPACASFDWYGSYADRGDDFRCSVLALVGDETGAEG